MYQKYEPPHRSKRKEEGYMAWMSKVNRVPLVAKGHIKDSNLKKAPSLVEGVGGRDKRP